METNRILLALGLSLAAGLATGIGGAIAFFAKRTNTKFLTAALGFSAGVMIYISFVAMFTEAGELLRQSLGEVKGSWAAVGAFFGGMLMVAIVDRIVPAIENPHEIHKVEEMEDAALAAKYRKLFRLGIMSALAIALHNFPEGLATFAAALKDPALGVSIAIAIAIHNIPEGIAVSIPIYYATNSRKKAFFYSFLSGLAEPLGAIMGYFLLTSIFNDMVFGILFAMVAGIMVFISLDELLPTAEEYGEHHLSIYGLVTGMMVMAISLQLI
ncbi:MAG: zinc transporter ZupT [bacterium]|nr:zinc transporter ZupT [bacterium]